VVVVAVAFVAAWVAEVAEASTLRWLLKLKSRRRGMTDGNDGPETFPSTAVGLLTKLVSHEFLRRK
jgi:hypothetical protein